MGTAKRGALPVVLVTVIVGSASLCARYRNQNAYFERMVMESRDVFASLGEFVYSNRDELATMTISNRWTINSDGCVGIGKDLPSVIHLEGIVVIPNRVSFSLERRKSVIVYMETQDDGSTSAVEVRTLVGDI